MWFCGLTLIVMSIVVFTKTSTNSLFCHFSQNCRDIYIRDLILQLRKLTLNIALSDMRHRSGEQKLAFPLAIPAFDK